MGVRAHCTQLYYNTLQVALCGGGGLLLLQQCIVCCLMGWCESVSLVRLLGSLCHYQAPTQHPTSLSFFIFTSSSFVCYRTRLGEIISNQYEYLQLNVNGIGMVKAWQELLLLFFFFLKKVILSYTIITPHIFIFIFTYGL